MRQHRRYAGDAPPLAMAGATDVRGGCATRSNSLEQQLERRGPGEPTVQLSLTDDVFLRSDTWARWPLGIPLPVD